MVEQTDLNVGLGSAGLGRNLPDNFWTRRGRGVGVDLHLVERRLEPGPAVLLAGLVRNGDLSVGRVDLKSSQSLITRRSSQ